MPCLHSGQQVVPNNITNKFIMAIPMSTRHSSFLSFRITLWATRTTYQLMLPQLQPSWAFYMVAALKGVQELGATLG